MEFLFCCQRMGLEGQGQLQKELLCFSQNEKRNSAAAEKSESLILERVTGIEPVYSAWKADILTIVLYPRDIACTPIVPYVTLRVNTKPATSHSSS